MNLRKGLKWTVYTVVSYHIAAKFYANFVIMGFNNWQTSISASPDVDNVT